MVNVIEFEEQLFRVHMVDGAAWFVAKDVCRCLGVDVDADQLASLADDERRSDNIGAYPGEEGRLVTVISETGLYRLVFRSRKSVAERLRRFVCHEVLPGLRRVRVSETTASLNVVKQARLTHGRKAARELWGQLGLPEIGDRPPPVSDDELLGYVRDFVEDCLEKQSGTMAQAMEVYRLYLAWATANKAPQFPLQRFGRMITAVGIRKRRDRHTYYSGYRIRDDKRQELRGSL